MTLERGDSPLAGRRPAPLSSVAGLGGINSISPIGSVHTPASSSSLGSLGSMSSMGPMGSMGASSSMSSGGGNGPAGSAPGGSNSAVGQEPRNATSFWLELKGVERWYETLESHDRMTLMASLIARSPEPQLHQYSLTIDKALRNQPTNLSRFGVRHNQPGSSELQSVYKYRSSLGKPAGAASPSSKSGIPSNMTAAQSGMSQANISQSTMSSSAMTGGGISQGLPQSGISQGLAQSKLSTGGSLAQPAASNPGGSKSVPGSATTARPSGAVSTGDGFVSPLAFPSSSSHASDLYSQAFLPLPRTQGYSPWGTEIRRPQSATADAWPDTTRSSPTFASVSTSGSPNMSSLSLETPPPYPPGQLSSSASNSTTQSPIGHSLKPWRTFTPHTLGQSASAISQPVGGGIGQAPDSARCLPHSSPNSPPAGPVGSTPAPVGSVPNGSSRAFSSQCSTSSSQCSLQGNSIGSAAGSQTGPVSFGATSLGTGSVSMPSIPLSAPAYVGSSIGVSSLPGKTAPLDGSPPKFAASASSSTCNVNSSSTSNSSGSATVGSPRAGSLTPKDNRLARRSVNVIDVELLSDIGAWLRSLRLHKYTGNLSGMRWQEVIMLSDQDLEDRGVNALGARRKLLKMFEEIRLAQEAGQLPDE